jgi:putative SOS response-associated peptidase YedK
MTPLVTDRERDESNDVSPRSDVFVVLDAGEARKVDVLCWGFVPGWAKDIKIGNRMINARAVETLPVHTISSSCGAAAPMDGVHRAKGV